MFSSSCSLPPCLKLGVPAHVHKVTGCVSQSGKASSSSIVRELWQTGCGKCVTLTAGRIRDNDIREVCVATGETALHIVETLLVRMCFLDFSVMGFGRRNTGVDC